MEEKLYGFENLLKIIDALPEKKLDNIPLRDLMPRIWPTLGDLRKLVAQHITSADGKGAEPYTVEIICKECKRKGTMVVDPCR